MSDPNMKNIPKKHIFKMIIKDSHQTSDNKFKINFDLLKNKPSPITIKDSIVTSNDVQQNTNGFDKTTLDTDYNVYNESNNEQDVNMMVSNQSISNTNSVNIGTSNTNTNCDTCRYSYLNQDKLIESHNIEEFVCNIIKKIDDIVLEDIFTSFIFDYQEYINKFTASINAINEKLDLSNPTNIKNIILISIGTYLRDPNIQHNIPIINNDQLIQNIKPILDIIVSIYNDSKTKIPKMNNSNRRFFFPQDWYPVLNLSKNTTSNKHYNISDIDETSIDAKNATIVTHQSINNQTVTEQHPIQILSQNSNNQTITEHQPSQMLSQNSNDQTITEQQPSQMLSQNSNDQTMTNQQQTPPVLNTNNKNLSQINMTTLQQDIGDQESGDQDLGSQESGDQDVGDQESGDQDVGDQESGDQDVGDQESGDQESGDQESGDQDIGDQESGDQESGDQYIGDQDIGDQESGDQESGDQDIGDQESGDQDIGDQDIGDQDDYQDLSLLDTSDQDSSDQEMTSSKYDISDHDSTGSENDGLDMDDVRRYFDRNERHNSFAKNIIKKSLSKLPPILNNPMTHHNSMKGGGYWLNDHNIIGHNNYLMTKYYQHLKELLYGSMR